ncbi:Hypothetical protein A7982_06978 [Minicystis rosea]|nr:Hypothetical protein A7982_06978 [Minicystis rosea]
MHADGYFALVLAPESVALLRADFATLASPIAHHCTVCHGTCDPADLPAIFAPADLGAVFRLVVTGFATWADGGVQAVVVALLLPDGRRVDRGFSRNAIPHVTVATDGVTEPFMANALLEAGFDPVTDGPVLTATLVHTRASSND